MMNYFHVKCERKVGVDPYSGGTHRMTSDEFFLKILRNLIAYS